MSKKLTAITNNEDFTDADAIAGIAAVITLDYDTLLGILQVHIKREYITGVESRHPGAGVTAYLDDDAAAIWDAAMKVALDRYLATLRPNADDKWQVENGAVALHAFHFGPNRWKTAPESEKESYRADVRAVMIGLAQVKT